jgi:hypothetical protein
VAGHGVSGRHCEQCLKQADESVEVADRVSIELKMGSVSRGGTVGGIVGFIIEE